MKPFTVTSVSSCSRAMSPGLLGPKIKPSSVNCSPYPYRALFWHRPDRNCVKADTIGPVVFCNQSAVLIYFIVRIVDHLYIKLTKLTHDSKPQFSG